MRLALGNHTKDGDKRATIIEFPDSLTLGEAFVNVSAVGGIWENHRPEDDAVPVWVASDMPGLAEVVASHFGGIKIRKLEG